MALIITVLKILSSTLAGLFGVIALLVEYKDDEGKITKWGKIALIGVVTSAFVSLSTQVAEHVNAEFSAQSSFFKAAEQQKKSERILSQLTELSRSTQPLEAPEVTAVFNLPNNSIGAEKFLDKLRKLGKKLQDDKIDIYSNRTHEYFVSSSHEGIANSFSIDHHSSIFPNQESSAELFTLLSETDIEISFFSNKYQIDQFKLEFTQSEGRPSTGYFGKYGDYSFNIGSDEIKVSYDISKDEIDLWVEGRTDERWIRKSGEISSYPDFEDSYIVISVDYSTVPSLGGNGYPDLESNRKLLDPGIMFIRNNGREFVVRDFEAAMNKEGYPVYIFGPMSDSKE